MEMALGRIKSITIMKVHITLVGGQPAPVYNGIVATQPDKIVYVYSDESREIAERISDEVKI